MSRASIAVVARDRSIVTRRDGVGRTSEYRRPTPATTSNAPRTDTSRASTHRFLAWSRPPTDRIVLEDVENIGDYESGATRRWRCGGGDPSPRPRLRRAARSAAGGSGRPRSGWRSSTSKRGAKRWTSPRPTCHGRSPRSTNPAPCSRSRTAIPRLRTRCCAPTASVVLVDFEYAGARHRGYDLAGVARALSARADAARRVARRLRPRGRRPRRVDRVARGTGRRHEPHRAARRRSRVRAGLVRRARRCSPPSVAAANTNRVCSPCTTPWRSAGPILPTACPPGREHAQRVGVAMYQL